MTHTRSILAASAASGALGSTPAHNAPLLLCSKRPVPHPQLERTGSHAAQRIGQILGDRSLDLADEAQG